MKIPDSDISSRPAIRYQAWAVRGAVVPQDKPFCIPAEC